MKTETIQKFLPLIIVIIAVAYFGSKLRPPSNETSFDLVAFSKIPVVADGRVKPLDTVARQSMLRLSNRQGWHDLALNPQSATQWMLDLMARTPQAFEHRVIRVDHPELLNILGLQPRTTPSQHKFLYSYNELGALMNKLGPEVTRMRQIGEDRWDDLDIAIAELTNRMGLIQQIYEHDTPLVIPPDATHADWTSLHHEQEHSQSAGIQMRESALAFMATIITYAGDDPETFASSVERYQELAVAAAPSEIPEGPNENFAVNADKLVFPSKLSAEVYYNHVAPFYYCMVLYVLALVIGLIAWLVWPQTLNRTAFFLILFVFIAHTIAIITRIYLSGRPPVTTLYSSALFVGWGAVMFGLLYERMFKLGIGNIIAGVGGFTSLLIAHNLALDGQDTLTVLVAVLDTNFWLATHVVIVTLGYVATYVAGLIGLLFILKGFLTPSLTPDLVKKLGGMMYGTLAFALLFSFVGTVLGGLWGDDSWGRFWGWDPKENGALLIVLWNALILHARWGGMIQHRGMAVLAVAGNIFTAWSWFGVNHLGIGLHSYGFTSGVV